MRLRLLCQPVEIRPFKDDVGSHVLASRLARGELWEIDFRGFGLDMTEAIHASMRNLAKEMGIWARD